MSEVERAIERGLGSRGRLRILRALAQSEEPLSTYKLSSMTGLSRKNLAKNLRILLEEGWIKRDSLNRVDLYFLNDENSLVKHLLEFFRKSMYI